MLLLISQGKTRTKAFENWLDNKLDISYDRYISLRHFLQTGSRAYSASCPVDTGGSVPGIRPQVCEADNSPPSSREVKTVCSYSSTPPPYFLPSQSEKRIEVEDSHLRHLQGFSRVYHTRGPTGTTLLCTASTRAFHDMDRTRSLHPIRHILCPLA